MNINYIHNRMKENEIKFGENIHISDVGILCSHLMELVEFRGYDKITLNFFETKILFADAALPLVAFFRKLRTEGVKFKLILPKYDRLARLFVNSNWAYFIDVRIDPSKTTQYLSHLPAQIFQDPDGQHKLHQEIMKTILGSLSFLERPNLRALDWSLYELTDNVITHANVEEGGLVQITYKHNAKEIQFLVADSGQGIPSTLREGLKTDWSDERSLEEAVREGVTRGTGQGNGLYGTLRIALESGGAFSINSGRAYLALNRQGKVVAKEVPYIFPGTAIDCTISISKPLVLERALNFDGRRHVPLDILDVHYEEHIEDGYLNFSIIDECKSFGSRREGALARGRLEQIVKSMDIRGVVFDFETVGLMSSSFADELIARFCVKYADSGFGSRIKVKNCDPVNLSIIQRSLSQRLESEGMRRPVELENDP